MNSAQIMKLIQDRPLSNTSLGWFAKSPKHYVQYITSRPEPTAAMIFGAAFHTLVLEPDEFKNRYAVKPEDIDRRTKAGKEAYAEFGKKADRKEIITEADYYRAKAMRKAIRDNKVANRHMGELTQHEHKIIWSHDGLQLISKLDGTGETFIEDLKSADSAEPSQFARDVVKYGLLRQAAMYVDALFDETGEEKPFLFIVVEKKPPFAVSPIWIPEELITLGRQEYQRLLKEFNNCLDQDRWDEGYEYWTLEGYHSLELPAWAKTA